MLYYSVGTYINEGSHMLNSHHVASRRIVHSARQLFFFQQKKAEKDIYDNVDTKEDKEDSKVYVLGYN